MSFLHIIFFSLFFSQFCPYLPEYVSYIATLALQLFTTLPIEGIFRHCLSIGGLAAALLYYSSSSSIVVFLSLSFLSVSIFSTFSFVVLARHAQNQFTSTLLDS
jgi:hypothetical protein